ncbi:hypothetical protein IPU70_23670 [Achromobacter sp. SD115]|uniref:hypothetical protein n=1 Tax=Achromobacter sp. SD115 TaxID=2782011 RepID=UPI001A9698E5|nr:hypothetical protein [Achromobacter sp. SD115]MBO1016576.1 hypothetical protein [Achromobacter sp. SD115]
MMMNGKEETRWMRGAFRMRDSIAARRGTSTLRLRLPIAHASVIRGLRAIAMRKRYRYAIKFAHVGALAAQVCCTNFEVRSATIFGIALNELPQKRQLALA